MAATAAALIAPAGQALATSAPSAQGAPSPARIARDARAILSEGRFRGPSTPHPFRGVLRTISRWLQPIGRWLGRAARAAGSVLPGGFSVFWLLLALLVLAAAAVLTRRTVRARTRAETAAAAHADAARSQDPRALEREAEEAERRGESERAIRLRFRAGVLSLSARGTIPPRASLTTGQLARTIRSPAFDALASTFEEVVYGGRAAASEDLVAARAGWRQVASELATLLRPKVGGAHGELSDEAFLEGLVEAKSR